MEEWREAPGPAVDVRSHEHVVVEAERRVVHRRVVVAELDAGTLAQGVEVVKRGADPSAKRAAQLFLLVTPDNVGRVRVGDGDPNHAARGGLAAEEVHEARVVLREMEERVADQVDVGVGLAEELPPELGGDVDAMRVRVDDLRCRRLGAR